MTEQQSQMHSRQESSISDEFGSFVTVPATDDPLGAGVQSLNPLTPGSLATFETFADDAKERTKKNEKRVLDELRAHEEDPLAWLNSGNESKQSEGLETNASIPGTPSNTVEDAVEAPDPALNLFKTDVLDRRRSSSRPTVTDSPGLISLEDNGQGPISSEDGQVPSEASSVAAPHAIPVSSKSDPLGNVSPSFDPNNETSRRSSSSFLRRPILESNEGPRERAERNEKRVLDELRAHEDGPLGWLKSNTEDDETLSFALREAGSTLIDLSTPSSEVPPRSPTPSTSAANSTSVSAPMSPRPPSLPRAASSPLIPRSPDRARSQSPPGRVPKSPSIGSSLSRSWMSSLGLFGTARAVPASSSPSAAHGTHDAPADAGGAGLSPTQSTLHALFARATSATPSPSRHSRFATEGHSPMHAATLPLPTAPILHPDASPFSTHVYIPPSGAPGFAGERNWNPGDFEFDPKRNTTDGKTVKLVGRREVTNPVLDSALAAALRSHLPPLNRLAQSWTLLYSADQHGLSLNTLYARCAPPVIVGGGGIVPGTNNGALIAIQDAEGGVFGAWVPEGVHLSHGSYYGGGDSFLWSVDKKDENVAEELCVYKWTGRNEYVVYCDNDGFSFGGGDGHYGLYVDASLVEGTTHPCPTFDNGFLAHGEQKGRMVSFDAVGLEVWSVGS
ncbi:TLD-domain-containing protein [Fomitiporia mediterranea MF3/22]|uniref:TLD-domain-containing protein n=1 Tax=Fomitiporia mediterranea (strain MF3/22) TaxID=694068 RepID=UPI0004407DD8|nr:TLD-domain-containing protein [Fomitiporia mediterranea MF3/22]EJD01770.1 TLD-domain-containing protein [Fomitiporia mediterranea MF3/22]